MAALVGCFSFWYWKSGGTGKKPPCICTRAKTQNIHINTSRSQKHWKKRSGLVPRSSRAHMCTTAKSSHHCHHQIREALSCLKKVLCTKMGPCWEGNSVTLHLESAESNINTYIRSWKWWKWLMCKRFDGDGDGEGNDDVDTLNLVSKWGEEDRHLCGWSGGTLTNQRWQRHTSTTY